jgi:Cu2+-exporting ATPase
MQHEHHAAGSNDHQVHAQHAQQAHAGHAGHVEVFRKRFWISLILTVPVLALAPMIQHWLGLGAALRFPGDQWVQFAFGSAIYITAAGRSCRDSSAKFAIVFPA